MNDKNTDQKQTDSPPADTAASTVVAPEGAKTLAPPTKTILGRKIGMTRIYKPSGEFIPVTVIEAGPCPVVQVKTNNNDGYEAVQLGFGAAKEKNVTQTLVGHFKKAGVKPVQYLHEFRLKKSDGFQAGQEILVSNFAAGDVVDVSGTTKGKGFAGVVKRFRFRGGPQTHGQSDRLRAPGASAGQGSQNVFKGKKGPGHMGAEWDTVQRLEVVGIEAEKNLMLINGSVPGPNGAFVVIKQTTRPRKVKKAPPKAPAAKKAAAKQPAAKAPPAKK